MSSILEQLYNGEIFPAEQYNPQEGECRKIYREHCRHREEFIRLLSKQEPPLNERFVEIMDELVQELPYQSADMFINGFRLGAKIMIEVLYRE